MSPFVTDKSPIPVRSAQLVCKLPALFCSPSLHAGVKQTAPVLCSCSLSNCPQHTARVQWSNTGCHIQTIQPRKVGLDDPWGHFQPGTLWNMRDHVLPTYLSVFETFWNICLWSYNLTLVLPVLSTNSGSQLEMQEIKWVWKKCKQLCLIKVI